MTQVPTPSDESVIDESDVAAFLENCPDFFNRHDYLLERLVVPHQRGGAVSLVERQTSLLRDRNQTLHTHLADLISVARHNDQQFSKTKRLVLALLEAQTLDQMGAAITESLCNDFNSDVASVLLFHDELDLQLGNLRVMPIAEARSINHWLHLNEAHSGRLRDLEKVVLFQQMAMLVKSAALTPLGVTEVIGVLAIGSADEDYFNNQQGTLFIRYIGEIVSRIAMRLLAQEVQGITSD